MQETRREMRLDQSPDDAGPGKTSDWGDDLSPRYGRSIKPDCSVADSTPTWTNYDAHNEARKWGKQTSAPEVQNWKFRRG